ncbi:hypothetical protein B0H19DRAFT_1284500 [Mycena capillaripes]|nr:hypothetical protein B0H19DRAFT_1284500 [Mycena capillaripes]
MTLPCHREDPKSDPERTCQVADAEEEDEVFNLADWIGAGKTWSENLPRGVERARNRARSVPWDILPTIIPDSTQSVSQLLSQSLPKPSNDSSQAATFSNDAPSTMPSFESVYTSISFQSALRTSFDSAWISGATSIRFAHLPDLRFPMWTENLLNTVQLFVSKRRRWEQARQWLGTAAKTVPVNLLSACEDTMQELPWDAAVPGLSPAVHLTTQDLALFLGSDWLNDEMINAGVDYILRRVEPGHRVRILNCLFIQSLANAKTHSPSYTPLKLSAIEQAIQSGSALVIYLPLHVNGNHWTLLKVDLCSHTIFVADSLRGSPPTAELDLIRWWVASLLPSAPSLKLVRPNIPCPLQKDSHSCGIIVLSMLATVLLDEELWCPAHAFRHRMEWFLRLSEGFADEDDDLSEYVLLDAGECGTTPDTSDYMSSHPGTPTPSSNGDGNTPDPDVSQPFADVVDDERLSLDAVDFFLEPMDVDSLPPIDSTPPIDYASENSVRPAPVVPSEYYGSDEDDSDHYSDSSTGSLPRRGRSGPKPGSLWDVQKQLKSAAKDAEFQANKTRLGNFRSKILKDDARAEFRDDDVRRIRCSHCAVWLEMRALYDILRWKQHRQTAKCVKIAQVKLPRGALVAAPSQIMISMPCPGLTRESDEEIATYLARTSVSGGGAPSRSKMAMDLFSLGWKDLDKTQHRMVLRRELSLQKWRLARAVGAVFSTTCLQDVLTAADREPEPCAECRALYKIHAFTVCIHRPMPKEKTMKYVPLGFRDPELGALFLKYQGLRELVELDDGRSPFLKFAQGWADGIYESDTLTGMIQALVLKQSRIQSGKSFKNMQYPPEFDQFCNLLASTSPCAYLTFQKTFGGRGIRSMRQMRAKLPRFAPGISAINVIRAVEILVKLEYAGPLGLSCDDTALEQAISVYQETKDTCLILGCADGVIRVADDDNIDAVLAQAQLKKADKLRVWVLSIPLPKIPPIMIATIARASSVSAVDLAAMHTELLNILNEHGIHPVSLSSDGAEVERAAQRIIAESATSHLLYGIPHSIPGCNLTLKIPLAYGHFPIIMTQDSKHALKTARNQLFTGARIIVIGFFVAIFSMLREMAANIAGPLFTRDVEKVDKQDDRAAARMFSANTLEFQLKNYPGQTGLSVYLFVFGELIDTWQNRNITHRDRAKMVLRAHFFLMAWRTHIVSHPDYSLQTQFISRESYDIFLTICDEACEHLFGMLRQLKKDFSYADVLYLERKLRTLQLGAFGGLSADEQANQVSAGYHHTYFKADDLDTATLMQYPSDADITAASEYGFAEAAQLLKLAGIDAEAMLRDYTDPTPVVLKHVVSAPKSRPPRTLLELLALYQNVPLKTSKDERTFESCELALAAESLDKSLAIAALPDATEESLEEVRKDIQTHLAIKELPVPLPSDHVLALSIDNVLNDSLLVSERLHHQTKSTAQAVRQHGRLSTVLINGSHGASKAGPSLRETLIKKLAAVVPTSDTLNKTTGVDRYVRHAGTFGGTGLPGNARAQNKATVQGVAASKFLSLRGQALSGHQWIHENMHIANISDYNPLKPGDVVVALKPTGIAPLDVVLGEVVTMYTKNTMHDWIPMTTSIGTPSYICISVYSPVAGRIFTSMSCPKLACGSIIQIPRTHLLFSFASFNKIRRQDTPTAEEGYPHVLLTLCETSSALFQTFRKNRVSLHTAVQELVKMSKSRHATSQGPSELVVEQDDDEDENADNEEN